MSEKVLKARLSPATTSGFWPTSRILICSGMLLPPRRNDPASRDPALALVWQADLEPVGALSDDLELSSVLDLIQDARCDGRSAADIGSVHGHDRDTLRQCRYQGHAHASLNHFGWLLNDGCPEIRGLKVRGDLDL